MTAALGNFELTEKNGTLTSIVNSRDPYRMNWVKPDIPWGTMVTKAGLETKAERDLLPGGRLRETYTFQNNSRFPVLWNNTDLGIYIPFNDRYESADVSLKQNCHAHLFMGGGISCVEALRMGGEGPHLGLVLTEGSLSGYSVTRDVKNSSNDRGCFFVHPAAGRLEPGECLKISWELFWFENREDFKRNLLAVKGLFWVEPDRTVFFAGEEGSVLIECGEGVSPDDVRVDCGSGECRGSLESCGNLESCGSPTSCGSPESCGGLESCGRLGSLKQTGRKGKQLRLTFQAPEQTGEFSLAFRVGDRETRAKFLAVPAVETLTAKRCAYIAERQQMKAPGSALDGAYLTYDREENILVYSHERNDVNSCRERIGMGVLMARYLQNHTDEKLLGSLDHYIAFLYREIYDEKTGETANDLGRNIDWHRLYNYPWMCQFQIEVFRLKKDAKYLRDACRTMEHYYENGGARFYAIGIPMTELVTVLRDNGMNAEADRMRERFVGHAQSILAAGLHYPAHEVRYEQSIVAPAVTCLLEGYQLSEDERFLEEARRQLKVLELFNGRQPDYHLFEVAIRHWDGYWFGKRNLFGDTFPHYWSALTGIAFERFYEITGDENYYKKAENSFRGVLSLFGEDGFGSCAHLFPATVNGQRGDYDDPWANDQDWGLYYAYRYSERAKDAAKPRKA